MEVARGHVTDRPFARTVYTLGAKRFTGDLVLTASGRRYKTSWEDGRVVAGESAAAADAPGRLALSAGLVTSSVVGRVMQALTEDRGADPIALLEREGALTPAQVSTLKRQVLAHAAARLFALPGADFVADNARSLRADPEVPPLDPRWLIYFGLRTHYPTGRLEQEMRAVIARPLELAADAIPSLRAFGFGETERPVLTRLRDRAHTVDELCRRSPELDRPAILALTYALVACDCVTVGGARGRPSSLPPHPRSTSASAPPPASTPPRTPPSRTPSSTSAPPPASPPAASMPPRTPPRTPPSRTPSSASAPPPTSTPPRTPPRASAPRPAGEAAAAPTPASPPGPPLAQGTYRPVRLAGNEKAAEETRTLIADKLAELDADADHFALLGVARDAELGAIRGAYFQLAKRLHPDRLRAVGILDRGDDAQRLFSAINTAFSVLSDPKQLFEYKKILAAGGAKAVEKAQREAEELAAKILAAEEHFRLGEMALRRQQFRTAEQEFREARDLNPDEGEYQALWAWAAWCNASDKEAASSEVLLSFDRARLRAPNNANVHLYHGRVLEQLGRPDDAAQAFRKVLDLVPDHREAELALRLVSQRSKRETGAKARGLFGRKKS